MIAAVIGLGLCGCGPMRMAADRPPGGGFGANLPTAIRRADNDFSPLGARDGTLESVPAAVRARLDAAVPTTVPPTGPAYVMQMPGGRTLFAVRNEGARGVEFLLVAYNAAGDRVSPTVEHVSMRRSPGDAAEPALRAPFARFEDLDGDGVAELLVQGTWAVGGISTSVVTRVFRLDADLRFTRVADFLTGDHFVWAKNPTGVWIVGDIHRLGADKLQIDYVCHPLGRPQETRPIGQVAFRYSASEGGYVEDGAHIMDVHFSDFLRLDSR